MRIKKQRSIKKTVSVTSVFDSPILCFFREGILLIYLSKFVLSLNIPCMLQQCMFLACYSNAFTMFSMHIDFFF